MCHWYNIEPTTQDHNNNVMISIACSLIAAIWYNEGATITVMFIGSAFAGCEGAGSSSSSSTLGKSNG